MKKIASLFFVCAGLALLGAGPCAAPSTETPAAGSGPTNINTTETGGAEATGATGGGTDDPARTGGVEAGNPGALRLVKGSFEKTANDAEGETCPVEKVVFVDSELHQETAEVDPNCTFEKEIEVPKAWALVAAGPEDQGSVIETGSHQTYTIIPPGEAFDFGKARFAFPSNTSPPNQVPIVPDANGNGIPDQEEPDADGDGLPNSFDPLMNDQLYGTYIPGAIMDRKVEDRSVCPRNHSRGVRIEIQPLMEGVEVAIVSQEGVDSGKADGSLTSERRDLFRGTLEAGFLRVLPLPPTTPQFLRSSQEIDECRGWLVQREDASPSLRLNLTCYAYRPSRTQKTAACYFDDFRKP